MHLQVNLIKKFKNIIGLLTEWFKEEFLIKEIKALIMEVL